MFEKNESTADRLARAAAGVALLATAGALCLRSHRLLGATAALAGGVLLVTATTGHCLIYRALGVSTAD